jgi:hypothetical protein
LPNGKKRVIVSVGRVSVGMKGRPWEQSQAAQIVFYLHEGG